MLNPKKSLQQILAKHSGRNHEGKITAHHIGGRHKRYYRMVDFRRDKRDVSGRVMAFEYDPNRNVEIALVHYSDGDKRYILSVQDLHVGDSVIAADVAEIRPGNALPLSKIPVGMPIHNVELTPGRGGILVRGAGTAAKILAKDEHYATVKLPSTETRKILVAAFATIGVVGNAERKNVKLLKAGDVRHRGGRPKVRGTAQNPRTHPHGGGEGRSGEGMKQPKTPWGKPARGLRTRKKIKYSNKSILERRKR